MDDHERLRADYAGTGLTIGPHPMALHRNDLALRGVLRATDLPQARDGRRVRVAGMVITRQRPGTAKGFVFLTLEDETGISNVIVWRDVFEANRRVAMTARFLAVRGRLQREGLVVHVVAETFLDLSPELARLREGFAMPRDMSLVGEGSMRALVKSRDFH